jgi:hypothetical protein
MASARRDLIPMPKAAPAVPKAPPPPRGATGVGVPKPTPAELTRRRALAAREMPVRVSEAEARAREAEARQQGAAELGAVLADLDAHKGVLIFSPVPYEVRIEHGGFHYVLLEGSPEKNRVNPETAAWVVGEHNSGGEHSKLGLRRLYDMEPWSRGNDIIRAQAEAAYELYAVKNEAHRRKA